MDDVIYRQAAIDAIEDCAEFIKDIHQMVTLIDADMAKTKVRAIPSAQQWIPCSERLPDIHEEVLVCDQDGEQRVYVLVRISDDEVGWEDDYGFYQSLDDAPVWMPLPEPYREETEP